MRRFPEQPRKKSRIEIIPMIDVMMFLLVFFVLISLNVIPALGLKVALPVSRQATLQTPPKKLLVGIPAQGPFMVDGASVSDVAALTDKLRQIQAATPEGVAVIVQGDEQAALQRLVEVMDTLKQLHIDAMTISAKRP